jgi:hypothetical protein
VFPVTYELNCYMIFRKIAIRCHRLGSSEDHLTLNGRNIPFVIHVKYLGIIFEKRITWRLHIQMIEAKAFRIFIRIYSYSKVSI